MTTNYDESFFTQHEAWSLHSAQRIVPLVLEAVTPSSVVDVGCGEGVWLSVFKTMGVKQVLGMDGSWVNKGRLQIDSNEFVESDLAQGCDTSRAFDLAVSVEVAEHLPPARARSFVRDLTLLAPCVLFSAAIPHQGGTDHSNEQWQEYWARLFREFNYLAVDFIRPLVWHDENVMWFYRQNVLMYVRAQTIEKYPALMAAHQRGLGLPLSVVHPQRFVDAMKPRPANLNALSLGEVLRALPGCLTRSIRGKVRRLRDRLCGKQG